MLNKGLLTTACAAGVLLAGSVAHAQLGAGITSPVPNGITAEQSAGFAKGKYAQLDALPDWGGIWFVERSNDAQPRPPQLKGEYLERFEQWREEVRANNGVEKLDRSNCSPPGLPRIMQLAQYPYEFLFTPGRVTVNQEAWMQTRTIWTDERQHPEDVDPSFHGHSVGHWEGDTLVVDTIGISDELQFGSGERSGAKHSDKFRLTERIYLTDDDPNILVNEMRMEDPEALEEPFEVTIKYRRDRHGQLIEFQCAENDRNPVDEHGNTLYE